MTRTDVIDRGATLSLAGEKELEDGLPANRASFTVDYARSNWRGWIRINHYGEVYEHLFNCESCAVTTAGHTVVDAEFTWAVAAAYEISLGLKNLFDQRPDKHQFAGVSGYLGADYPLNHPAGFNGGSYHVRVGMSL